VTSFLLNDPSVDVATKGAASQSAAQYYRLAWSAVQSQSGKLYMMVGLSGSGKTTVARELASRTDAIHIRSDSVRKHLAGVPLNERGGDDLYTPAMSEKTYSRLLELGITLARAGFTVVLDAKYDRQTLRQQAQEQAKTANIPLELVRCTAPQDVLEARLEARSGDIADATVAVLRQQQLDPLTEAEQAVTHTIDTTKDVPQQIAAIVEA
jgi:hypothetical protein